MDVKFNVYYSLNSDGPWILSNPVPLDNEEVNSYTITGLKTATLYYVAIIGGYLENNQFLPLIPQSIGPYNSGAKNDLSGLYKNKFAIRTSAIEV